MQGNRLEVGARSVEGSNDGRVSVTMPGQR
jgi:hypothetical protein